MLFEGQGLRHIDAMLEFNPATGKPFDETKAIDEIARMVEESTMLNEQQMQNVPESVRRQLWLLTTAVGCLVVIARKQMKKDEP